MQVSRSGQIRRPCIHTSSPVFTTAVTSCSRRGSGPATRAGTAPRRLRRPALRPSRAAILARVGFRLQPRQNMKLSQPTEAAALVAAERVEQA